MAKQENSVCSEDDTVVVKKFARREIQKSFSVDEREELSLFVQYTNRRPLLICLEDCVLRLNTTT
jgi:hypothetical protein